MVGPVSDPRDQLWRGGVLLSPLLASLITASPTLAKLLFTLEHSELSRGVQRARDLLVSI